MSYPMNSPYPNYPPAPMVQAVVVHEPVRPASTGHVVTAWVFAAVTGLYLLPWAIAATRSHQSVVGLAWLNFFFGWTGIGWLLTLIWACVGVHTRPQMTSVAVYGGYQNPSQPLAPPVGSANHGYANQNWTPPPALPPGNPELNALAYQTPVSDTLAGETSSEPTWPQYRQPS